MSSSKAFESFCPAQSYECNTTGPNYIPTKWRMGAIPGLNPIEEWNGFFHFFLFPILQLPLITLALA